MWNGPKSVKFNLTHFLPYRLVHPTWRMTVRRTKSMELPGCLQMDVSPARVTWLFWCPLGESLRQSHSQAAPADTCQARGGEDLVPGSVVRSQPLFPSGTTESPVHTPVVCPSNYFFPDSPGSKFTASLPLNFLCQ